MVLQVKETRVSVARAQQDKLSISSPHLPCDSVGASDDEGLLEGALDSVGACDSEGTCEGCKLGFVDGTLSKKQ